jgi:hypothetical protein
MKLESLTPLERIVYVAEQRLHGAPIETFCILATTSIQHSNTLVRSDVLPRLIQLLGPVLALEAFAEAIGNKLRGVGQVYLLGDQAVSGVAEQDGFMPEQSWNMHLEALACSGVIFRFPVALKFGYADPLLTQVRSNSWGRAAFDRFDLRNHIGFHSMVSRLETVLETHRSMYLELVRACQIPLRPLDVERIHTLNEAVPIPIVT